MQIFYISSGITYAYNYIELQTYSLRDVNKDLSPKAKANILAFIVHFCAHLCHFYPRDAMLARVIAIATCLSVRPSVCPSLCPSRAGIVSKRRKLAT